MLTKGMMGDRVIGWQRFLTAAGHYDGFVDGYFGDKTASATADYRRRIGLGGPGVVDADTLNATRRFTEMTKGARSTAIPPKARR